MSRRSGVRDVDRIFIARQPVFDRQRQIVGYELLYRRSDSGFPAAPALGGATALMVCEAVFTIGFDRLSESKQIFIRADREFLLGGAPEIDSRESIVFTLGSDIVFDEAIVNACRALKAQGFKIGLPAEAIAATPGCADVAEIVAVSFDVERSDAEQAIAHCVPGGAIGMAVDVHSARSFGRAFALGYRLFQGTFFGKPALREGRMLAPEQMNRLKLLQALQNPLLTVDQLDALIKSDPALCYRILRTVNSAACAARIPPSSIRDALLMIGRDSVKRWASLWALSGATSGGQKEVLTLSVIRARCCEVLAGSAGESDFAATGFLVGICSLLDVILEQPMAVVLEHLGLQAEVRDALAGQPNRLRRLLDCIIAYTSGRWQEAAALASELGLDAQVLPGAYGESLRLSRELQQAA